jgi:hypothetical protein
LKAAFLLFAVGSALVAQIGQPLPGQYPPGQYPPGQNPRNNGPGLPMPGGKSKKSTEKDAAAPTRTFSGVIRVAEAKTFDLETTDTRILTIQLSEKTTKTGELQTGEGVDVEVTQDTDGNFHAISIKPNAEIAKKINVSDQLVAEERTVAPPTILVRPDQKYDEGDSGAPKLKRGMPTDYSSRQKQEEREVAAARDLPPAAPPPPPPAPKPADSRKEFIEKARGVAVAYIESLPNYVCQEFATRYVSETRNPSWNVVDVVSAEVVYENHKESYRNVAINGKATKKAPEESGAWSTGEFGTILKNLFEPASDAEFRYAEGDTIAHLPASVYKFAVERQRSNWKIWTTGQYIIPGYKGSVWLDKANANALRIEMQAVKIPEEFPLISVESAIDYQYISLGTPDKFLLPVRAEVLSCERGSNRCERNVIEFRNYHKFTGESTIKFNDK